MEQKEAPFWDRLLRFLFQWLIRKRKIVLIGSAAIAIWGICWTLQIQTNNLIMDDLHPKEQLKKDFRFIDKHYGGIRPFDVSIAIKDPNLQIWDPEVLQELATVEAYLEKTYGAQIKNSLVQSLRIMNRATHQGRIEFYTLPAKFIKSNHSKSNSGWEKVMTKKLKIEKYKNELGFEQIAKDLGIKYPNK